MLHTKFRENWPTGSREEDFLNVFYHIWAWRPSWSCDLDFTIKLSFPCPWMLHINFQFDWPCGFRKEDL